MTNEEIAQELVNQNCGQTMGLQDLQSLDNDIVAALRAKDEAAAAEVRRLQDGVRDHLIRRGAPDSIIDGAGCDSGDPLDFTTAEISQALNYFEDAAATALAEAKTDERDRFRKAIIGEKWPHDATDVFLTLLAAVELPDCICGAKGNSVATGYMHHTGDCPCYFKSIAALITAKSEKPEQQDVISETKG